MSLEVLVETLKKENQILKDTIVAKDSIINSLEEKLGTVEQSPRENIVRHQSPEDLSEIDKLSFGEKVALYVMSSENTLSARDTIRRKTGKEMPYDPNPIGKLKGEEVVLKKTDNTKFAEVS